MRWIKTKGGVRERERGLFGELIIVIVNNKNS